MSDSDIVEYVYAVDWDDSVHRPPYHVEHRIRLSPGVTPEQFEQFMREVAFPAVAKISTRVGRVDAQTLLLDVTGQTPTRYDSLDFELGDMGEHTGVGKYRVVARWTRSM